MEFKHNNDDPQQIGEYISALANSAALLGKQSAYLVWGIDDDSHEVIGTRFNPSTARHKQQELESWLLQIAESLPCGNWKVARVMPLGSSD